MSSVSKALKREFGVCGFEPPKSEAALARLLKALRLQAREKVTELPIGDSVISVQYETGSDVAEGQYTAVIITMASGRTSVTFE